MDFRGCFMASPVLHRHHRLYIDESGDHALTKFDNPGDRYLGLLGVWFERPGPYMEFTQSLDALRTEFFGKRPDDAPVLFHRKDIIDRKGSFWILRDESTRTRFNKRLLDVIAAARFKVVCVVQDKKKLKDAGQTHRHPYHYCMRLMLERFAGWLDHNGQVGDVAAEARGQKEDALLKQAYTQVYTEGTEYHKPDQLQRVLISNQLHIRDKLANVAGLQLADLLAHPMKQVLPGSAG